MEAFQKDLDPATSTVFKLDETVEEEEMREIGEIVEDLDPENADDVDGSGEPKVIRLVKSNPHLRLLPANAYKKRFPVQCKLCQRRKGHFAIFDLIVLHKEKGYHQHVNGATHKAQLKQWTLQHCPSQGEGQEHCQGLCVQEAKGSKLHMMIEEFRLWAVYYSPGNIHGENPGHHYSYDMKKDLHVIVHHRCEKPLLNIVRGKRTMCSKCASLQNERSLLRQVWKFFVKQSAARALACLSCLVMFPQYAETLRDSDLLTGLTATMESQVDGDDKNQGQRLCCLECLNDPSLARPLLRGPFRELFLKIRTDHKGA